MTNVPTEYSVRFVLPDLLERGRANTLRCPVVRSGVIVTATSGTISILDAGGTEQVSAASCTISSEGVATYSYTPASTLSYGEGWEVRWDLLLDNGARVQATNECALVRARLNCPVSDYDLYQRVSGLDPSGAKPIHSQADFQSQLDLAWQRIERRLIEKGNRPNLISSPASFFDAALNLTLALIFENFSTRLNSAYMEQAKMFRAQYENAWKDLRFLYTTDDAVKSASGRRRAAEPPLFASSRR